MKPTLFLAATILTGTAAAEEPDEKARAAARRSLLEALDDKPVIREHFDTPEEGYHYGYLIFRPGEKVADQQVAQERFKTALDFFQTVRNRFPDWKPPLVQARIAILTPLIDP